MVRANVIFYKIPLLLLILVLFTFCTEDNTKLEVKKLSEIKGSRESLEDSCVIELISFSGYDVKQNDVSPQIIVRSKKDDKIYRLLVLPLFSDYPVKKKMYFRHPDKLHLDDLKKITDSSIPSSGDLKESMEDGYKESQNNSKATIVSRYLEMDEANIKVFFNPRHKDTEEQEIPVVIGWIE